MAKHYNRTEKNSSNDVAMATMRSERPHSSQVLKPQQQQEQQQQEVDNRLS